MSSSINQQLLEAIRAGNGDRVKELLSDGADVNCRDIFNGTTPLHEAVTKGDIVTATLLIVSGADVNHCDNNVGATPLGVAVLTGNVGIVRLLLTSGARLGENEGEVVNEVRNLGLTDISEALQEWTTG